MQDQMRERLAELRSEQRAGEGQLLELAQQENVLRETLLRISGAIQVLQELLDAPATSPGDVATPTTDGSAEADLPADGEVLTVP